MRVSWTPAASTPRSVALSGSTLQGDGNSPAAAGGSSGSSFGVATLQGRTKSLPIQGSYASPVSELDQLRTEVARLRAAAQNDAKEKETLHGMVNRLQKELRHALDENRALTEGAEERKQLLDAQSAQQEADARDAALNNAKDLFKSMLGAGSIENRNTNRDHQRSPPHGHKRRQPSTVASTPPSGMSGC